MLIPKVIISGVLLHTAHRSFVVSIYGCRKINIQPCTLFSISRVSTAVIQLETQKGRISCKTFPKNRNKKTFPRWDYEKFKSNETRKTICWNFYGCLSWADENSDEYFFFCRFPWIPSEGFEITSLREYQCRKMGLRSSELPMDSFISVTKRDDRKHFVMQLYWRCKNSTKNWFCLLLAWKL